LAQEFRRFGSQVIEPHAERIHREDLDIPDEIIEGLASMGAFGLSIPEQYGGMQDDGNADHLPMVVATEELSRVSLGAAGSLITRPEILARALTSGGTEQQKLRWLPEIASGSKLVAVATTEPNTGSDVATVRTAAVRDGDVYRIRGTKTWATFAGRADLLMLLARTDPDPSSRHRGLSLFVIEKPRFSGHSFEMTQRGEGRLVGRAIPTLGYRGMHSFELAFDNWEVPAFSLIGGNEGAGRGFQLQMEAFAAGRLQTAARAVGVMRAGYEAAREYAAERHLFGRRLIEFPLTVDRLASMASRIAAMRLFNYHVAGHLTTPVGQLQASMVKALSSRAAEEITRDSMQIFGGYGYAEEYPVSRYFVDARVLSIFEGAEEVLALRVIARQILEQALN
jgi:(2S)-methylsuccinyl-CoA dehydrogenase